ncbi:membrane protein [Beggiatoa sp. PS]|nr:membrane protein [Beggiatoa sp. PS]
MPTGDFRCHLCSLSLVALARDVCLEKEYQSGGHECDVIVVLLTFCVLHFFGGFSVLPIPIGKATIVFFVGLFSFITVSLLTQQKT